METDVIQLTYGQVAVGYVFVLIVLAIMKRRGISREKELIIATLRMTVQLVLVGFVLTAVFERPHPLITFSIIMIMVSFAIHTIWSKFRGSLSWRLKKVIAVSMIGGSLPVLMVFMWIIIRVTPYYNPRYFIPVSGMIIGNSMTGISLAIHTMIRRFTRNRIEIEESLILGATPGQASEAIINDGFDAAIMPTVNNMLGMGIISLPGMMTGQILSGVAPTMAILYQIAVMLGIMGGASITSYMALNLGYRTWFNDAQQLVQ
jgi:putative ABC transport system permease protein